MSAATPVAPSTRTFAFSQLGDEMLARKAASGNDAAFTALYERYHGPLLGYCRSILLDSEDAHDATQSALENALRALPQRDTSRPLRPWLYKIAHNEAINIMRRRRPHDELTSETEPVMGLQPSPEVYAEQRNRLEQLVADLQSLPERQRGALVMRELNGLTYDEIGLALGLTPANARRAVFDARSALHDAVDGRDTACQSIRVAISDGDRRSMRARGIRAHLRSCDQCRTFQDGIRTRQVDFPALAPWLGGATAASVIGIGATGVTSGTGALVAAGGGGFSWAAMPAAAKGLALVAVVATGGTAAIEIDHAAKPDRPAARVQAAARRQAPPPNFAHRTRAAAAAAAVSQTGPLRAQRASAAARARRRASATGPHTFTQTTKSSTSSTSVPASVVKPAPAQGKQGTAPPPPPTAPPATVSKPKPKPATPTLQDLVAQKIQQIQAQVQAVLAQAQAAAAAGTTQALQQASALVTTTISGAQAQISRLLASIGISVPSTVANASTPPASNPTASNILAPVQQVLGGVSSLLSGLLGHK